MSAGNMWKKKCFTNNQSKGNTEQQYDLIVHPLNSPHILTDVKVQAQAVGYLLIGDKVGRNSSVGVVSYFSPAHEVEHLVAALSVPSKCCYCSPSRLE